jgi:hypothetical protein
MKLVPGTLVTDVSWPRRCRNGVGIVIKPMEHLNLEWYEVEWAKTGKRNLIRRFHLQVLS